MLSSVQDHGLCTLALLFCPCRVLFCALIKCGIGLLLWFSPAVSLPLFPFIRDRDEQGFSQTSDLPSASSTIYSFLGETSRFDRCIDGAPPRTPPALLLHDRQHLATSNRSTENILKPLKSRGETRHVAAGLSQQSIFEPRPRLSP